MPRPSSSDNRERGPLSLFFAPFRRAARTRSTKKSDLIEKEGRVSAISSTQCFSWLCAHLIGVIVDEVKSRICNVSHAYIRTTFHQPIDIHHQRHRSNIRFLALLGFVARALFGVATFSVLDFSPTPTMSYWLAETTQVSKPTFVFLYSSHA